MLVKISEYKTALNFEGRSGRNFADWLRADRESNPERIDNEIAYDVEFVRKSLRKRLNSIEKKYSESFPYVVEFVNGAELDSIQTKSIIKQTVEDAVETVKHEPEIKPKQTEPETVSEIEPDVETDSGANRIDEPEELETEPKPNQPQPETIATNPEPIESENASRLRTYLTNPETMLWGTVAVIFVFLPFTVLNLYQYISIETNSAWGDLGVFLLCCGIAFVWDISILLFAVNGKHQMSKIGAGVLFVFMAAKFDFFKRIMDLFGADGEWWQLMFVLSAIVFYSPVLIHQYTKLSVKHD
jgi:hypothetical protein